MVEILAVYDVEGLSNALKSEGIWLKARAAGHICSKCHEPSPSTQLGKDMPTPYCPWCGAKMIDIEPNWKARKIYYSCR